MWSFELNLLDNICYAHGEVAPVRATVNQITFVLQRVCPGNALVVLGTQH